MKAKGSKMGRGKKQCLSNFNDLTWLQKVKKFIFFLLGSHPKPTMVKRRLSTYSCLCCTQTVLCCSSIELCWCHVAVDPTAQQPTYLPCALHRFQGKLLEAKDLSSGSILPVSAKFSEFPTFALIYLCLPVIHYNSHLKRKILESCKCTNVSPCMCTWQF